MFSILHYPELDWAEATRAKYSGRECSVEVARVTFSHSLKLPLDVRGALGAVERAVRECVAGERLVPCAREYFDVNDRLCRGGVVEQDGSYMIPLVYTNDVYASVMVSLLQQEVERRWLEMFLGGRGAPHRFQKSGSDLQIYSRTELIATVHFCSDDLVLEWPKTVVLQPGEAAAILSRSSFVLDNKLFRTEQFAGARG